MLAINAKRGVESTVERVFNSTGNAFSKLQVLWTGSTAGIMFKRGIHGVDAKIVFPAIDEGAEMKRSTFNNLIGYAIHELGHAWFTDNQPWDQARNDYGQFVGNLINGLEDPRIERKVIESGYAPNAKALFEELLNSILKKNGYVEADDLKNVPFLLAVEGRRLNGYHVDVPSVTDLAPWSADLHWALAEAQLAKDTKRIAEIAIELFKRLKDFEPEPPKGDGEDEGDGEGDDDEHVMINPVPPTGDQPPTEDGDDQDGDGDGDDQDGEKGGKGDGNPTDKPTDGDGDKGGQGDDKGSEGGDQPSDEGQPTDGDKPADEGKKNGGGKDFAGGRNVEPNEFIEGELNDQKSSLSKRLDNRPSSAKPTYTTFEWV
jgi:hypothetical protein